MYNLDGKLRNLELIYESIFSDDLEVTWSRNVEDTNFSSFYIPLLVVYKKWMHQTYGWGSDQTSLFAEGLLKRLHNVCTRTLVSEIHLCKEQGLLLGFNEKEQYNYYNDVILKDKEYIEDLFGEYLELKRIIFETIFIFGEFTNIFFIRFQADKEMLNKQFFPDAPFSNISFISSSNSDKHNGAETLIIKFDNSFKLVYKPKNLENEIIYKNILNLISGILDMDSYQFLIMNIADYGWEEYIPNECTNKNKEKKLFFQRMGIILCINYLLGTSDMHYENMISYREFPTIIDLETILFVPQFISNQIDDICSRSVLSLGILPQRQSYDEDISGIDVSLLGGGRYSHKFPIKVPRIINEKTSSISIDYVYPTMKRAAHIYEPERYIENIIDGFRLTYEAILSDKLKFLSGIEPLRHTSTRVVYRDTQLYSQLLSLSYHPDFLKENSRRESVFQELYKNADNIHPHIIEEEIAALMRGDIPVFYQHNNKPLNKSPDAIESVPTAYKKVIEKVENLNFKDMERQILLIQYSFYQHTKEQIPIQFKMQKNQSYGDGDVKAVLQNIADYVVRQSVYVTHSSTAFIGLFPTIKYAYNKCMKRLDYYLYDGISGLAIFLHAVNKFACVSRYNQICSNIDEELFDYTDNMNSNNISKAGAFSGEASILFTYIILYHIQKRSIYLEYAIKHYKKIAAFLQDNMLKEYDIIDGYAGIMLVFSLLYDQTKELSILAEIERLAEVLLHEKVEVGGGIAWNNSYNDNYLIGFSHGNSGIALALAKLHALTDKQNYLEACYQCMQYEKSKYCKSINNWIDQRDNGGKGCEDTWCNGVTGILLGRIRMQQLLSKSPDYVKKAIAEDITNSISIVNSSHHSNNYCLCHGAGGNSLIFAECIKQIECEKMKKESLEYVHKLISDVMQNNWCVKPEEFIHPGIMTGISGIGYSIMKYYYPLLPDILSFTI